MQETARKGSKGWSMASESVPDAIARLVTFGKYEEFPFFPLPFIFAFSVQKEKCASAACFPKLRSRLSFLLHHLLRFCAVSPIVPNPSISRFCNMFFFLSLSSVRRSDLHLSQCNRALQYVLLLTTVHLRGLRSGGTKCTFYL